VGPQKKRRLSAILGQQPLIRLNAWWTCKNDDNGEKKFFGGGPPGNGSNIRIGLGRKAAINFNLKMSIRG